MIKLETLDLCDNFLTKISPEIVKMEGLMHLFLGYNKIKTIPEEIMNLKI